jgi:hypothetical protein
MENTTQELERLFRETASAHHQAFLSTDGYDPQWPEWYADYLHAELSKQLNSTFTRSQLADLLVEADQKYRDARPEIGWEHYYADFFVKRFS